MHDPGRLHTYVKRIFHKMLARLAIVSFEAGNGKSHDGRKTRERRRDWPGVFFPAMTAADGPHDPYASLRIGNFRWFIISLLAMNIATQLQGVVVAWQIYALTHDPLSLGLIGLTEAVPFIALALPAGHLADRAHRLAIARAALAALLACSVSLLLFTVQPGVLHVGRVWPIYLVIGVSGVARSFLQPSRTALSAEMVPRALYPNAVTWRSSTWQLAAVIGPAVGGLVYGFGNATSAYVVDVSLMGLALLAIARIAHPPKLRPPSDETVLESLATGVRFVRGHPVVLGALALDLFSVLFGGATALLPVFAAEILHVGPEGLGVLRAAPAAGAVVMSLLLAHRPPLRRAGRTLLVNVALFGVAMIVFGLSRSVPLSLAALVASGMVDTVSVVVRSTLLQVLTPEHLLGRVSAVNAIFIGSSNEIGAFESGVAAKLLGTVPSVVLGGMATLGVVAVTALRVPQLRRLRQIR
jgi:MFS family permease